MKIKNIFKYLIRFVFLQSLIFFVTSWYFDNFVFISSEHKFEIYQSLVEDRNRFYDFLPLGWITIDGLFFALVLVFLIILYSTKFYTYVNELDFSYKNSYLDDYLILYLLWNSFIFSSLYLFRITGLSRSNLFLFSFIIPFLLISFRNSEIISTLLGRSLNKENYISFNVNEFSNFKNLRIMAYRNEELSITCEEDELSEKIIIEVDKLNKIVNINLVILQIEKLKRLPRGLEKYLIGLNKKVLIISSNDLKFNTNFIYRKNIVESKNLYYFNNDIQYGSKFILKRIFDILIAFILLLLLLPIFISISLLIRTFDGNPVIIKQKRVGLHGKQINMYKFRTMYNNSHEARDVLKKDNNKSGPLFKMDRDPRLIPGLQFLRKFSLDELPQLVNVLKGEMSLVGPRPLFKEDTEYFNKNYMRRLNVLPGMTGLLQINERNTDDFEIWYKYDIEYIENWSLYLDFKILFKTFSAVYKKSTSGK
jgi:lipopolysaccharide/colanic/teichoic acid biosynthesis glycosyltransferase